MAGYSGGTYTRNYSWVSDRLAGINITDSRMDTEDNGFADALSRCILKDGSQTITADIPFNGKRITGLAWAALSGDAIPMGQGDARYVVAATPAMTGALTITSSSAASLAVGPTGGSNPVFDVNSSTPGAVNGVYIVGATAGAGPTITSSGPGATVGMVLSTKGGGALVASCGSFSLVGCTSGMITPNIDCDAVNSTSYSLLVQNSAAGAVGDAGCAGIAFTTISTFGTKLKLRNDGRFGVGGWGVAEPWVWHVDLPSGNVTNTGTLITGGVICSGYIYANGGNIVIGTADPSVRFNEAGSGERRMHCDVGAIRILNVGETVETFFHANDGTTTVSGNVTAYSDARLKDNIETISDALSRVRAMRGVHYTRKSDGVRNSGVTAQELQAIAPELVRESRGTLSVAYGNLVAYLIEAVKALANEVDDLKAARA